MLFSILMCTLNSDKTLRYALDSVRRQSFHDWELIVLDNGSMDGTVEILKEYQKLDSRIRCGFRGSNIGWQMGIRICLGRAQGEYMMFLGADDLLAQDTALQEVADEIAEHHPDIVWTGCEYAMFENGNFRIVQKSCPDYHVYCAEDKLTRLEGIMRKVYYNSVMHYVRIDFLKEHGIDFYEPFYGDCMGMTEALCRAEKMVVMDKIEYVLTINTSQTSSKTGFDYDISRQWKSIKEAVPDIGRYPAEKVGYVAGRVLDNLAAMYERIVLGAALRNKWMSPVEATLGERFLKAEEWISSDAFGEMMYFTNRRVYQEKLLGAAGVLYWICKKNSHLTEEINKCSMWLAGFSEAAFTCDECGKVQWKQELTLEDAGHLQKALTHERNAHRIGAEILLREDVICETDDFQREITAILNVYIQGMVNKFGLEKEDVSRRTG